MNYMCEGIYLIPAIECKYVTVGGQWSIRVSWHHHARLLVSSATHTTKWSYGFGVQLVSEFQLLNITNDPKTFKHSIIYYPY